MDQYNNKRIAKNTIFLYIRMFIMMIVSLYTSRIILQTLGVEDYGIFNIVGSIIVFFSFIKNAMAISSQRFLNFYLGKNDKKEVNRIFSMSLTIHIIIAIIITILGETIGLWFFNTRLNIPIERFNAAQWVYQCSIVICFIDIIRIPYNAIIIAYEKMSFYAYISIIEAFLKLSVVFILMFIPFDKLISYSFLLIGISFLMFFIYKIYCNKTFSTSKYYFEKGINSYRELITFSGWSLFGAGSNILASQGLNVLLNIFYGVIVNAAVGIANQFGGAVYQFISNFQTSFAPQITKLYASNQINDLHNLIFRASKFSYFLMLLLTLPLLLICPFVLEIWLGIIPKYSVEFCQLWIIFLLIEAFSAPLWLLAQAHGDIKKYQILMSLIILINLPVSYVLLKLQTFPPYIVFVVRIIINICTVIARIIYLEKKMGFPSTLFVKKILTRCLLVTIAVFPIPIIINYYTEGWIGIILTTFLGLLISLFFIFYLGLERAEKSFVKSIVLKKLNIR